jgi:hypothetical protein
LNGTKYDMTRIYQNADESAEFLAGREYRRATLSRGDCAIMDSRLLHCGDSNWGLRRGLLYFTMTNPASPAGEFNQVPQGSIFPDMNLLLRELRDSSSQCYAH